MCIRFIGTLGICLDRPCVENLGKQCLQRSAGVFTSSRLLFLSSFAKCPDKFPQNLVGWEDGVNVLQFSYPKAVDLWESPILIHGGGGLLLDAIIGGPWDLPSTPVPQEAMKIEVAVFSVRETSLAKVALMFCLPPRGS